MFCSGCLFTSVKLRLISNLRKKLNNRNSEKVVCSCFLVVRGRLMVLVVVRWWIVIVCGCLLMVCGYFLVVCGCLLVACDRFCSFVVVCGRCLL